MNLSLPVTLALAVALTSCASSPKTWGNAQYTDAGYDQPHSWNEGLNEFDQRRLLSAVVEQLERCPKMRKNSTYMLSAFENQTSSEIDLAMLTRELNDHLSEHGFTTIFKASRREIASEVEYQQADYVSHETAAVKGRQVPVEYLLRSVISAKAQNNDDVKTVRYRMSIQAVNLESSLVACNASVEIKKQYERTRVSF